MHVGVKEAVAEHLIEERFGADLHDDVGIVARRLDGSAVTDWDAVDPLQRQHPLGGSIPVDGGGAIARIVDEVQAQLLGRGGLHAQVHLDPHHVGEGAHRIDRLQPAKARLGALDQLGHPVEEVEIALEGLFDTGPQHLHRNVAAVGGDGEMHLGDRGGGDGLVLETREQRVDRLS